MNDWMRKWILRHKWLFINQSIFPQQVRNCRLSGLLDLALDKDYVRTMVADYMNRLIDIGVAGFRLDAAKHMWPGDIKAVLDKLHNLNTQWFSQGSRPFIFQEVEQYIDFLKNWYYSLITIFLPSVSYLQIRLCT